MLVTLINSYIHENVLISFTIPA